MKRILLAVMLSVVAVGAQADYCTDVERLAYSVMKANQQRVPIAKALEVAGSDSMSRAIVIDAYNVRSYLSEEAKEIQRQRFAQKWLMKCIGR